MSQAECDRLREEKELALCTFSPKIKNLPSNFSNALSDVKNMPFITQKNSFVLPVKNVLNRSASSMQRSQGLYKSHMEKQYNMEQNRKRIFEERIAAECTFKPKINGRNEFKKQSEVTRSVDL